MSDLVQKSKIKNNDLKFTKGEILVASSMRLSGRGNNSSSEYMKTYNVIRYGEMLFEGHSSSHFQYGRFVVNDFKDGIVSHVFDVFKFITPVDELFKKYYFHSERVMRRKLLKSTSNARMLNSLNFSELASQFLPMPIIAEQSSIGLLLKNIDNTIAHHQQNQISTDL